MKKLTTFLKSRKTQAAAVVTAGLATPFGAFAADQTVAIGTAVTEGTGNVSAVIAGVISIAILGFGINKLLGWFTK